MPSALRINNNDLDVMKKKSKEYYTQIKSAKAQFANNSKHLKRVLNLFDDELEKGFALPLTVATEPNMRAFQYKVLNSILYTNIKLYN